jgi:CBS domain-containing protein
MNRVRRPIRVQRIHTERGVSQGQATVQCPISEHAIAASRCRECPHAQKASTGASRAASSVECLLPGETSTPSGPVSGNQVSAQLHRLTAAEVMTQDVRCVTADVSLERLAKIFGDHQIGCAPVLDGSGVLIGLVTKTDVVCEFFDFEHEPPTDVSDVMTQRPVTVRETSTLAEVVTLLSTTHHHLPVLSADGRVVGIISALDIIQWLASSLR